MHWIVTIEWANGHTECHTWRHRINAEADYTFHTAALQADTLDQTQKCRIVHVRMEEVRMVPVHDWTPAGECNWAQ